jgi:Na+:H+ antiporter, NhaC family
MLTARQLGWTVAMAVLGLASAYLLQVPLALGFILGLFSLIGFTKSAGLGYRQIANIMWSGVKHTKEVMWILLLVGLLIPAWTASGTIPLLIDTGLSFVDPSYFVTFSFVLAAMISMILGTSTGTLSSVGIPLIGVGAFLQIPLPLIAGALASGAFVGDRTSPFSSAHQLVAASTGLTVKQQYKALLPTTVGAIAVAMVYFLIRDIGGPWHHTDISAIGKQYSSAFSYSGWLLLPVCILLGSILLRMKTRYGFLLSIVSAIILGSVLQGIPWGQWLHDLWWGYQSNAYSALHTKGLVNMADLIVLIALAGAFNGILEETRALQPYMEKIMGASPSLFPVTVRTALFGLALGLVSCTQTLPIMMTGRSLLPLWTTQFPQKQLSRVVADTSLIFAAMIPWNMLAIVCGTVLGVPAESYVLDAPFLWSLPLMSIGWSLLLGRKYGKSESMTIS